MIHRLDPLRARGDVPDQQVVRDLAARDLLKGAWRWGLVDAAVVHHLLELGYTEVYLHMLRASDYGVSKNWVLVAEQ